jgi:glucokinase
MAKPGYIGIEIGGTKLQAAAGGGDGRIRERFRAVVDRARGAAGIREAIAEAWARLSSAVPAAAVGVGFGGPIDWETGAIAMSYHVEGWHGFDLCGWLRELTGRPVAADNDANVAALGEALCGAGRDRRLVFFTTLGSGMGGGMVVDGRIYHGAKPGEAEVGQMPFDKSGATCESRCCGWAADARVRAHVRAHPGSILARLVGAETRGEARFLGPALRAGCPGARAILDEQADDIAFALSHAAHLFHPEAIILGGGLSLLGEPLRAAVASRLPGYMTEALKPGPEIRLPALGEESVVVGALVMAAHSTGRDARPGKD